jgi:hypothetical protein
LFDECSDTTARRSPDHPLKEGEKDRHRLSGPLSGRGCAPTYDQPRQPILTAIIVAAQPAIVVVAAQAFLAVAPQVSRNLVNRPIVAGLDHFASKRQHGSLAVFGFGWVLGYNLHYLFTPQRQRLALFVGILVSVIDPRHTGHR